MNATSTSSNEYRTRSVGRSVVWALVGRSVNRSVGASKTKKCKNKPKNHEEGGWRRIKTLEYNQNINTTLGHKSE